MKIQKIRQLLYVSIIIFILAMLLPITAYAALNTGSMPAPESVSWDTTRFNRVNFTPVDNAYGYEVRVYRDSALIYNIAYDQSDKSYYDVPMYYFIEDGKYKVAVAALASEDELHAYWMGDVSLNFTESAVKSYYPATRMPMITGVTWTNDRYITWDAVDGVDDYAVVFYKYTEQDGVYFWYRFDDVTGTGQYNYLDISTWDGCDNVAVQVFAITGDINNVGPGPLQATAFPNNNSVTFVDSTHITGKCGENATYIYANGNLYINGTGAIYNDSKNASSWSHFSSRVKKLIVEEGITELYGNSFSNFSGLETIEYSGTKEAWVNIKKSGFDDADCQHMLTVNVKCSDGIYAPLTSPQNIVLSQDSSTGYLKYSFDPVEGAGGYYISVTYIASGSSVATVTNTCVGTSYASNHAYSMYLSTGMQEIYDADCSVYIDICSYHSDDCIAVMNGIHKLSTNRSNTLTYIKSNSTTQSVQNITWSSIAPVVSWDKINDCDGYEITIYTLVKDDDKYQWTYRCATNLKPGDTSLDILNFCAIDSNVRDLAVEIRALSGNLNNKAHSKLSERVVWKWNYSDPDVNNYIFYLATYSQTGQMLTCNAAEYDAFMEYESYQKFFVMKKNSFVSQ